MKYPLPSGFRHAAEAAEHFRCHDMTPDERTAADLILNSPSRWDSPRPQRGLFSVPPTRELLPGDTPRLPAGGTDPVGALERT